MIYLNIWSNTWNLVGSITGLDELSIELHSQIVSTYLLPTSVFTAALFKLIIVRLP